MKIFGLFLDPGKVFIDVCRVDDQHIVVVFEFINNQVVDGTSIGQTELGVESLVDGKTGYVVGNKVLQECKRICIFDFEFSHMADVEEASMGTNCAMLVYDTAI